ncbi:MAG: hypothetical protein AB1489_38640, partial [Acidobacteriota bacterium]
MLKGREFLARHISWVFLLVVNIPLLIILFVQYRSLVELERTLPIANRTWMKKYLITVGANVEEFYRTQAERVLSIAPEAFIREHMYEHFADIANHFECNPATGVKRLFIAFTGEKEGQQFSIVLFYTPQLNRKFTREPGSQAWRAAHAASGHWLYHSLFNSTVSSASLLADDYDLENRIITKPILNSENKVIAVAGLIIDEKYFKEQVLPNAVQQSLKKFFPSDYKDVIVTLHDPKGNVVFATASAEQQSYEASEPLLFIFKDCRLKIMMR